MSHDPLDLTPLFEPAAVAVVGASRSPAKVGGLVLANLIAAGYKGRVYPVNPEAALQGKDIMGLPAVSSAAELPDGLDLAVICLPREQVLSEMRILADKGVRAAIVLAAGFRETGRLGFEAEMELKRIATEAGMILLGPNSLGLISTGCGLNVSFAIGQPKPGGVAFFSQSGAMCVAVLDWAMSLGIGFSRFVSLGNKALLDEAAVLRHLGQDPQTKVILGYCESVEDGPRFMAAAAEVSARKPVLMLKAGSTAAGARAVSAHTGAISGSPAAYRAAFLQSGLLQVDESSRLFGLAQAFATQPLPAGPGLAILTNSGGPGILAADACAASSLTLPRPSTDTLARLTEILPSFASAYNPVDLLGDAGPERYAAALEALLADTQTHAVLVLLTPTAQARPEATARAVIEAANGPLNITGKPVAACFMGREAVRAGRELLQEAGIPCYDFPEPAVEALDALYLHFRRTRHDPPPATSCDGEASLEVGGSCDAPWDEEARYIVELAKTRGLVEITGVEALEAAHAAGLPVLTTGLARTSDEAVRLAGEIGLPVSLTLATPEAGPMAGAWTGARPGDGQDQAEIFARLNDEAEVRHAFLALTSRAARLRPEAYVTGCLVQAAPGLPDSGGFNLVVGFTRDPQFGPLVSFGLAGVSSELLGDVSYRLAPLSPQDAREMLREVRFYPLLRGARGGAVVSLSELERLLMAVSRLALRLPLLVGADFSPVLAGPGGVHVAGARLVLG
ncbi:MAG: acetate--CoA ligase family protein [Humidesulfovibrio sp.]|uniref:acetate--CoA ligase family protein n=1 Tax=Humidesulfovibrio sp. TaxID=2910988 RepID=UPI0027E8543D|nr:acetate--CoA ligase family protein [Humidesulfovibrio sp.]MDQ7836510.1 acetate--CoA ligase family protein [Humidesulfovibrio sp.]